MSSSGHGLAPAAVAGIVIGTLFVLVGLSAAGIILHYRRRPVTCDSPSSMEKPAPLSKTPQRRMRRPPSRKPTSRLFINEISFPMPLARKGRDRKRDYENSPVSTLDMVISPSLPRIFKLSAEGGESAAVEVRVTPPTPVASRAELGVPSPTKLKPDVKARFQASSGVGLGMLPMGNESTRLVT